MLPSRQSRLNLDDAPRFVYKPRLEILFVTEIDKRYSVGGLRSYLVYL